MNTKRYWLAVLASSCLNLSCSGGTGTGNPAISISSRGYNVAIARSSLLDFTIPSANATTTNISSLKFCVSELRFLTDNGSQVSVPETNLGLVDLGDGSGTTDWGRVTVPESTSISRVYVELERDSKLCPGANYSIEANGMDVTSELEFRFVFSSPVTVGSSGTFTFSLTNLAAKIDQALQAGAFDNAHIGQYLGASVEDQARAD